MSDDLFDSMGSLSAIAAEVFAAEIEMARRTENLGYMARVMAQVTLPHSKPTTNEYTCQPSRNSRFEAVFRHGIP